MQTRICPSCGNANYISAIKCAVCGGNFKSSSPKVYFKRILIITLVLSIGLGAAYLILYKSIRPSRKPVEKVIYKKETENIPAKSLPDENINTDIKVDKTNMALIPAGDFVLGSTSSDSDKDERTKRNVYLDDYYIDKYEVSVGDYKKCVEAGVCKKTDSEKCAWDNDKIPANCVNWQNALKYCNWVGKTLPTEAQWEKAARAGRNLSDYCFGSTKKLLQYYAWYKDTDDTKMPRERGLKLPNKFGLYDVHGNVWEWTKDWYGDDYSEYQEKNPTGPEDGEYKVVRGGSFLSSDRECRSSNREYRKPKQADITQGFRCAFSAK
jgi:formylglycine-generating enzyme required for sulfatase activity